jgi:hypothetical protein
MKFIFIIIVLISLLTSILICQETPDVDLPLTVSDNLGNLKVLQYGLDALATDEIDTFLGEVLLPPPPPAGAFDARFNLSGVINSDATWKDYRQGVIPYSGMKIYFIQHQASGGAGSTITIQWNMPNKVSGILQDMFGGVIVNVSMWNTGSYTLTNLAINPLKMIITYDNVLPVELTYFTATLCYGFIKLEWTTSTEVSNYGFEIEKRTDNNSWDSIRFIPGHGNASSPNKYYFEDSELLGGTVFQYRLKQIDNNGTFKYSQVVEVHNVPDDFEMQQNYPNPFNPSTKIKYQLPKECKVLIKIYNLLGAEVQELLNENKEPGIYEIEFNAEHLPSGIYIYRITTDNYLNTKKMVLLR